MARDWDALLELKTVETEKDEKADEWEAFSQGSHIGGYYRGQANCAFRVRQWILDPDAATKNQNKSVLEDERRQLEALHEAAITGKNEHTG